MKISFSLGIARHEHCKKITHVFIHLSRNQSVCDLLFPTQLLTSLIVTVCMSLNVFFSVGSYCATIFSSFLEVFSITFYYSAF